MGLIKFFDDRRSTWQWLMIPEISMNKNTEKIFKHNASIVDISK